MNQISRKLCLVIASAAVIFAGCTKKPRPTPADTSAMGSNSSLLPNSMGNLTDTSASTLQPRTDGVIEDADTIRGLLVSVYFDFDRSAIKQEEKSKISAAADYLKKTPQYRLMLEGHCDWRGTSEYNLGLGDRRAQAVKKFLQSIGASADKLQILSKGSLGAIEKGTAEQMEKDRRVDFVILKK
jgi:peptidoglycan-associated lipoprotein